MSGPVSTDDAPPERGGPAGLDDDVEVAAARESEVGGFRVRRALPRRGRRTIGAWCFLDHMGPGDVERDRGLAIGPHPHIGLQTVTWLVRGEVLHRDSLGTEQVIRPGQLNLMTAGRGVSHSEEGTASYAGSLHGVQLWVAQPEATRHGAAAFEHHAALPEVEVGAARCTVLVGSFAGSTSPARRDTDHLAVELVLAPGRAVIPLRPADEHGIVVLEGQLAVAGRPLAPGHLAHLGTGREELALDAAEPARALLVGGLPFPERVLMWWNYVAREREEITGAHREWVGASGRFGDVASPLDRIVGGPPPWQGAGS